MKNIIITIVFLLSAAVVKAIDISANSVALPAFFWEVKVPIETKECVLECSYDSTLNQSPYFVDAVVNILSDGYVTDTKNIQLMITGGQYDTLKQIADSTEKADYLMSLLVHDYDSIVIIN